MSTSDENVSATWSPDWEGVPETASASWLQTAEEALERAWALVDGADDRLCHMPRNRSEAARDQWVDQMRMEEAVSERVTALSQFALAAIEMSRAVLADPRSGHAE